MPNAERQSDAEYDVARDYFYKGDPRRALDHCRRAVELDDENAKALYFASTIHLFFCSSKLALTDPDCRLADAETYVDDAPSRWTTGFARPATRSDKSSSSRRNTWRLSRCLNP